MNLKKRIEYKDSKLGAAPLMVQALFTELTIICAILSFIEKSFFLAFYAFIMLNLFIMIYNNHKYFKVKYMGIAYTVVAVCLILYLVIGLMI